MELLDQYLALTDDAARAAFLAGLTADQLTELNTAAEARFAEAEAADPSDENLVVLESVGGVLEAVAGEEERRVEEATDLAARQQAVIDRVRGQGGDGEGDPDPEADPAADPEADPEDPPADSAADPEADPEAEPAPADAAAEPVAAGGQPMQLRTARPRISATARPAGPGGAARPTGGTGVRSALVASADVPNIAAGSVLVEAGSADFTRLGEAVLARLDSLKGSKTEQKVYVATSSGSFPAERTLDPSNVEQNMERIMALVAAAQSPDPETLVAAGGFCAPAVVRYDLPVVGENMRDVRDSLLNFGVPRGRVRWMPSPQLSDVDSGAVDQWTEQDDIDALTGTPVKPCLRVECPEEEDAQIYAVTRCLEFGNFNARTYPEQISAYTDLVGVWHARFAEQLLLDGIDSGSTAVTSGQLLGATSDALAALDRLMMGIRSRYRIRNVRVRVILPDFFREMVRVDISRQIPGGMTLDERYAVADAKIAQWFSARNANITWTLDSQIFGPQGVGPVGGFPSTVIARVYVEGTWSYLDGGELNLGIIRDSTLVGTNDFQMFAETFEGVAKFGPTQSFKLTMDLCPDGSVSGTVDIDPCSTGS